MDYIKLIKDVCEPIVTNPELLNVTLVEDEKGKLVKVVSNNENTAKLIGKGGIVANSIREIVNVAAKLNNERVFVKFLSEEER